MVGREVPSGLESVSSDENTSRDPVNYLEHFDPLNRELENGASEINDGQPCLKHLRRSRFSLVLVLLWFYDVSYNDESSILLKTFHVGAKQMLVM